MEPKIKVEQQSARPGAAPDRWLIEWNIHNLGAAPIQILSARCPHGKFRGAEKEFAPGIELAANRSGRVELEVSCGEPPGAVVENAFLIVRVLWAGSPWLVLARLRVSMSEAGAPTTATESITVQRVGFSSSI